MAQNENDREDDALLCQSLDDLPREMLFCIMSYCDPRSLVNVICCSKNLRTITMQILLMGFRYDEIIIEGTPGANWYSSNSEDRKEIYPANLLGNYIDSLMTEQEVEMDRINLINFTTLGSKEFVKLSKFISKFNIPELIVSPKHYNWVKNEINSSLKSISRLSFGKELDVGDGNYFQTLIQKPLIVCNGLCAKNAMDVKNIIGNTQLCSGLKVLTLCVYTSVLGYSFKEILKNCPSLREFNLFINGFSNENYRSYSTMREDDFEITDELMEIICNSNLEILRFDTSFNFDNFRVINQLTENKTRPVFPKLKIYSNHLMSPDMNLVFLPNHPLQTVSMNMTTALNKIDVPKCQSFFNCSQDITNLPIVDTSKYTISRSQINLNGFYENLAACTSLKDLHLFNVETNNMRYDFKNIHTSIEQLDIKKSRISVYLLNHIIDNSPNLKILTMDNVKVRGTLDDSMLEFENQEIDSQLRYIHISTCSERYPIVFSNILKKNLPYLHSVILENTYSIGQNSLLSLFSKASSLSVFKVTGAEFTDDIIVKFFNSFSPVSLEYGIDFSFNGKNITSSFLLQQPYLSKITTLSLPDCTIPNDDFIKLLDLLNPQLLKKIQVNLGNSGPTIETFKKVQYFKNLEMIYLSGKPEKPIEHFENFVLKQFVESMPSMILLFLDSGEFIKEEIELAKLNIRSQGKSAPKLILPHSKKDIVYKIENPNIGYETNSKSYCFLQ
ncbi:hypothetical protein NAEGRDRAFT_52226 [Naegleria gruberi]|uniref:F-box domain-containing protein n=1 Tax=Naegleria gruberi TaxID=5762 RepID=D2VTY0_NAEGR|nr:uncharacterized protein NAEGRDRAFT_52226 [Naegleria gruberi]EFC39799.1 hypothetical protein NAEGRDRAFT_52226 [Naegleria gruberi]|eukprot:XP_002672543.1 hypothetical protein NAEGRDRAFT_52226 [Naegleria gruberi strain NEG-M]